jgi:7,8-dihydropterin-6-yl-methyl-4-(beta-D-ribofuranosyl)aminobenzene 5'-phosphate synthase
LHCAKERFAVEMPVAEIPTEDQPGDHLAVHVLVVLEPIDGIEVQTLMDNASDLLLRSEERARRPSLAGPGGPGGPTVEAPIFLDPKLPEMLVAEHGFSALLTVTKAGRSRRVMFDAGLSVDGLSHNLHALQISIADVEAIVMSHGHFDHVGGLNGLIRDVGVSRLPMLIHPDFWLRRRLAIPGQEPFEMPTASRAAMAGAGFEIIEGRAPSLLMGYGLEHVAANIDCTVMRQALGVCAAIAPASRASSNGTP